MVDGHCVFLDLRKDKYFCLGQDHSAAIMQLTSDAAPHSTVVWEPAISGNRCNREILGVLVNKGLVVPSGEINSFRRRAAIPRPTSTVCSTDIIPPPIRALHILPFLSSVLRASISLRWRSMESTVQSVAKMRSEHSETPAAVDSRSVAELTWIFQRLRPYYPKPYRCLFDSLALLYFLGSFSLFPTWVFAVRLRPFSAHCWVQLADQVVNDDPGRLRAYSPIMHV